MEAVVHSTEQQCGAAGIGCGWITSASAMSDRVQRAVARGPSVRAGERCWRAWSGCGRTRVCAGRARAAGRALCVCALGGRRRARHALPQLAGVRRRQRLGLGVKASPVLGLQVCTLPLGGGAAPSLATPPAGVRSYCTCDAARAHAFLASAARGAAAGWARLAAQDQHTGSTPSSIPPPTPHTRARPNVLNVVPNMQGSWHDLAELEHHYGQLPDDEMTFYAQVAYGLHRWGTCPAWPLGTHA